ncbi:MAG: serine/threonine-protein kinase, partial [Blastocatellia bacterium]
MDEKYWNKIKEILEIALDKETGLDEYLDQACKDDLELRAEVASLLEMKEEAKGFLEIKAVDILEQSLAENSKDKTHNTIQTNNEQELNDKNKEITGRVLGDFLVKEKLGEGGFGVVYQATQITLQREVVVKILRTKHRTDQQIIERFKREAYLASRLEHPYCAHIYSFGAESDGLLWIAMEMVTGTSLRELLKEQKILSLERVVLLIDKICEVLHTAHEKGIVHRDIKPANIMIVSRAGRLFPKLLDFGIAKDLNQDSSLFDNNLSSLDLLQNISFATSVAQNKLKTNDVNNVKTVEDINIKIIDNDELTNIVTATELSTNPENNENKLNLSAPYQIRTIGVIGSPAYMSPEQWNKEKVDARSDIYSLGILTYRMLTGELPFKEKGYELYSSHVSKIVPPLKPTFPALLNDVMQKVLAKSPEDRYQSALEFAKDFRHSAGFAQEQLNLPELDELLKENLLANAPKPIADTVSSLIAARNAYQFRDRVLLVFHTLVHYLGILSLTSYVSVGKESNELVNKALLTLSSQALSEMQWVDLCRTLCRPFAKKQDLHPIPELVNLFFTEKSGFLSSTNESFAKLLDLQEKIRSYGSSKEDELIEILTTFLNELILLLQETSWLNAYYLVLPQGKNAIKWMGITKDNNTVDLKSSYVAQGKPTLIDAHGYFVLSLWPLIEIAPPTPGSASEVFLLESKGRNGAKLVSFPQGFEIESESPWEWLKEHFFADKETSQEKYSLETSPYLGLTAFSATDSTIFFGRERETQHFLNRLRIQPILALVGPSGAGKSSFLQAGVIASVIKNWQVITLRPGISPLATLSAKFSSLGVEIPNLRDTLQKDINALGHYLRQFAIKQNKMLLIAVDQFEEIITLCLDKEEQSLYVDAIVSAARSQEDLIRVVLTMRDDFLVRAKELKGLKECLSQSLEILTTPASEQLLNILILPARRVGYEFEDKDLAAEIVEELTGQTSALPLLAFTAAKLWEQRDKQFKQLRRRSYQAIGGVAGALARHAEEMLEKMTQSEQALVREAFHHLITSEGTRAILTREEILQLLGKTEDSKTVIEKLISARLLIASEGEKGVDRIEIIHETLLSAWPRLVKWRQEDQEGARLRDQLRSAARQWQERNRPKGLLWRDEALTEYQLWRARYNGKLTEVEEDFAQASTSDATRNQRIRRALAITAMLVLMVASTILFYQRQLTQQQLLRTLELYEEQSRQEINKGNLDNAIVYLGEAYTQGLDSLALKYMLAVILAKIENHNPIALNGHTAAVKLAAFSPDDQLVVSASVDQTARIWRVSDAKELFILKGHQNTVITAQFSLDGKFIVTSSLDKTAKIWKVSDGSLVATLSGHTESLQDAIFSSDGKQIVTISYDKTAKIWDSATGKLINTLTGHKNSIYAVNYSKDSKLIATASADKTVRIWDSSNGKLLTTLTGHQASVISLAFSTDNKLLITGSIDKTAKVWQVLEGKLLYTLVKHKDAITDVEFNVDGKTILTTSKDKTACLWDGETGNLISSLLGHQADIEKGEFSPDGNLIITSSQDSSIRLWERATGKFLAILSTPEDKLIRGVFSGNGEKVLTTSLGKTIRIWSLLPETRSPKEVALIIKEKVPVELKDGKLISKGLKTDNEVKIEKQNTSIETTLDKNIIVEILDNS